MFCDRYLIDKGKKQKYGTQFMRYVIKDTDGKYIRGNSFFLPIEDEKNVNNRRKELGLETTIEEYASKNGVIYEYYPEKEKLSFKKHREKIKIMAEEQRKEIEKQQNQTL